MTEITFRTARMETGQLVIDIPKDQRGSVMSWLKSKKDRDYDLTIKEHRRARDFSKKVKERIAERDSFDGHPCCINCGHPAPPENPTAFSNAHYISRAQGGLGIEENGLTLCPKCHHLYDQTTARPRLRKYFREYLMDHYPGWDEEMLYYRK